MADAGRKPIKRGVLRGRGRPPGFEWNVDILDVAYAESCKLLSDEQRHHLADQVRELARQIDPTHSETVDVRPIEDYHELRDKGGILNRLNIRVFFALCKRTRTVIVMGTINKKNDGATPVGERVRIRRRCREYMRQHCQP
jgi:hypothetical protein